MADHYSDKDNQYIIDNYNTMPVQEIANNLGRSYASVIERAKKLEVKKYRVETEKNIKLIIKLFIKYYCTTDREESIGQVYKIIGDEIGVTDKYVRVLVSTNFPLAVSPLP